VGNDGVARRASYGPRSPVVGERGARTRAHILERALGLFADRGYPATSVDDIAAAAGVSRATLYQYFAGKDQIFAELLDDCGAALMRLIRRLGPLGPDAAGFDNLHWWLGEWAWVYDRYAPMFLQWDVIDHAGRPFRPMVATFVGAYAARIAARLAASGFDDPAGVELGAAVLLVVHRVNLYRNSGFFTVGDRALLDGLAVVVQLVLFPQTPPAVLGELVEVAEQAAPVGPARPFVPTTRPDAGLGTRGRRTVRRLLDAGASAFAAHGYRHANLDAVAAEAGVARATLYRYFHDKAELLAVLSDEAAEAVVAAAAQLPGPLGGFRAWLDDWVAVNDTYAGVMAVWFDEREVPRPVRVAAAAGVAHLHAGITELLAGLDRPHPVDPGAAALVMLALLQRVPGGLAELFPDRSPARIAATMALFAERGLLPGFR
jgi:AcrR family transcriptional regulator